MFQKLGYTIAEKAQKHRVSYTIENIRIDFDKFDNIPRYLEIE